MGLFGVAEIEAAGRALAPHLVETPVLRWGDPAVTEALGTDAALHLKLELFQRTNSFKPRGALTVMLGLAPEALARGVTTLSAGNHAIATAYAARALGTSAKIVMARTANPMRVARTRALGAEVLLVADVATAFKEVERIAADENRSFVHPFEGPLTSLGTATLGLELCRQVDGLDAVIVAVGGGGLASGVSRAVKLANPGCAVFGVEPEGAPKMRRSLDAGSPQRLDRTATIADSLAPPFTTPLAFALCRDHLDDLVLVSDDAMRRAMALCVESLRLTLEPAGAAALAAAFGPLRERLAGRRVAAILCGANITLPDFAAEIARIGAR